jgi:hypothetical protein
MEIEDIEYLKTSFHMLHEMPAEKNWPLFYQFSTARLLEQNNFLLQELIQKK